jgi:hypothetical protein
VRAAPLKPPSAPATEEPGSLSAVGITAAGSGDDSPGGGHTVADVLLEASESSPIASTSVLVPVQHSQMPSDSSETLDFYNMHGMHALSPHVPSNADSAELVESAIAEIADGQVATGSAPTLDIENEAQVVCVASDDSQGTSAAQREQQDRAQQRRGRNSGGWSQQGHKSVHFSLVMITPLTGSKLYLSSFTVMTFHVAEIPF